MSEKQATIIDKCADGVKSTYNFCANPVKYTAIAAALVTGALVTADLVADAGMYVCKKGYDVLHSEP